ncbi:hypothetical protein [Nitrosomonas sp. sh817]|uniref:hypothetical protein n=1 Tax=Nitrosomonas sp. sh817 TaxID=3070658 RepID=UPI0027DD20FC|nr:hypothetical protein [Nitrosomonas sp. sh817]WMJ09307.1 hypothetical protein RBH92_03695 [Nitrosomonas sp. sh817]
MNLKLVFQILIIFTLLALSFSVQSETETVCPGGKDKVFVDENRGFACPGNLPVWKVERAIFEEVLKTNKELTLMINHLTAINNSLASVPSITQTSQETKNLLNNTITNFNKELRSSINSRFDQLPQELAASEAMKKLKEDILLEVDKKINAK